ncbi:hypothetical protein CEXT_795261 [Caerostris extrusa]|uniref:Uncharacterized protein n=1 Tax=Caerostris extrusa TaxID=172846 RepID=A0AAV4XSR0_CAEEX|nr:hypothetical protein CEXT_795261 [Caerostris extrusa]
MARAVGRRSHSVEVGTFETRHRTTKTADFCLFLSCWMCATSRSSGASLLSLNTQTDTCGSRGQEVLKVLLFPTVSGGSVLPKHGTRGSPKLRWTDYAEADFKVLNVTNLENNRKVEIGMEEGSQEGLGPPWADESIAEE